MDVTHAVLLTEQAVSMLKFVNNVVVTSEWRLPLGDISHCLLQLDFCVVEIVVYRAVAAVGTRSSAGGLSTISISCISVHAAVSLYKYLSIISFRMGNPAGTLPLSLVMNNAEEREDRGVSKLVKIVSAMAVTDSSADEGLGDYQFGSANMLKFPSVSFSEMQILNRCSDRLRLIYEPASPLRNEVKMKFLDECVWQLICEWQQTHRLAFSSRCAATLILNNSATPVQILNCELVEGKDVVFRGTPTSYDVESRTILPLGGSVLMFTFGKTVTLVDLAHVKVRLETTAFNSQISTRGDRTTCNANGEFQARFLEKTLTDWWGKYIILIT